MSSDWEDVSVGEITKWYSGGTPDKSNADYWGGNIPWISARNMKTDWIYTSDTLISKYGLENGSRLAPIDSLLLLVRGSELYNRIPICYTKSEVAYNQDVKCIICNGKANPLFLYYWIKSNESFLMKIVESTSIGAGKLDMKVLRNIKMSLPSENEQKNITKTISCIDDKIELNNRMNKTLTEMAQAIFKSWFVDFEPFQDAEFVDSELGRIPKTFTVSTIGNFSDIIDCLHSKKPNRCKSGKPFLQLNNIRDSGLLDMKDIYYITEADYLRWISRCEASEGDCVITNVGRVGAVSQIPEGIKAALGRNMTCVRCKRENSYPTFLIECLVSEQMRHEIEMKTDSGTILNSLNVKNIPKLRFICPDINSLDAFEKISRPIRKQMENIVRENRLLSSLRDTLLPKLMSGEIRVPVQED